MDKCMMDFKTSDAMRAAKLQLVARILEDFKKMVSAVSKSFLKQSHDKKLKLKIDYTAANFKLRSLQQRRKQINANYAMSRNGSKWSHHKRKSKRK